MIYPEQGEWEAGIAFQICNQCIGLGITRGSGLHLAAPAQTDT